MADCPREAGRSTGSSKQRRLFLADAENAVRSKKLQPQMVVHAMLSNNWENRGIARGTEFNRNPRLPTFVIRRDSVGLGGESEGAAWELFPVTKDNDTYPRVNFEFPYWSPWPRCGGQPSKEELEAYANIKNDLEWAWVPKPAADFEWKLEGDPGPGQVLVQKKKNQGTS